MSDPRPLDDRLPETPQLSIGERIVRDEGFKKLHTAKEHDKDTIQFRDHPEFGPLHLHVNGKACPFRIKPEPGVITFLRKRKPERSPEGIILPEQLQGNEKHLAIVWDVGPNHTNEQGIEIKQPAVKTGDEVIVSQSFITEPAGPDWPILTLMGEESVMGKVVRPAPKAE